MGLRSWVEGQISTPEQFKDHLKKYGWRYYLFQFSLVNSSYSSMTRLLIYYTCLLLSYCALGYHTYCYVKTTFAAYKIGHLDMAAANVHSVVLAIFIVSVTTSYVVDKRQILNIEVQYKEILYHYEDGNPNSPKYWFEHVMDYLGNLGIVSGGIGLFVAVYVAAPLIDTRWWNENCLKEKINFCIALPMYHPYESDVGWRYHVSWIVQTLFGIYRISVFCSVQTTLLLWPAHLIRELKNLKYSLEQLEERIKAKYYKETRQKITKETYERMYKDKKFNECAKFCLYENVKHHQHIITYFNSINEITALPCFLAYTTGIITMGIAMVKLLSVGGTSTLGANLAYAVVLGAETGFMIIISTVGQAVIDLSEEIFEVVSHIRIEYFDLEFRKSVNIFMEGTINPIALSSSKFNKCNMEALGNVMNAAYSFYQVSSASTIEGK